MEIFLPFFNRGPEGRGTAKAAPAGRPAASAPFLRVSAGSENTEGRENGREAAGREAGCSHSLGFLRGKNPRLKNGREAVFEPRKG
jgi:hypothetical protein